MKRGTGANKKTRPAWVPFAKASFLYYKNALVSVEPFPEGTPHPLKIPSRSERGVGFWGKGVCEKR